MKFGASLRIRDFRLLWTGLAVSLAGNGIFAVAIAWQAYAILDRPIALALVGLSTTLPQVLTLLGAGAVTDRRSRRRLLIEADLARAAAVGALAVIAFGGHAALWQLCAVGAVLGVGNAFGNPTLDAVVPEIVPDHLLGDANALDQAMRPVSLILLGPALGGAAVALAHPAGAFALDAASFGFSALCVARTSYRPRSFMQAATNVRQDVVEGWRYVAGRPWLWATFVSAMFTYLLFLGPTEVLLPFLVRNALHAGAATYGAVLAAGGAGAVLGAATVGRLSGASRRPMVVIYVSWTLATLGVAGYGLATGALSMAVAAIVVNGFEAAGTVIWATLKQRRVANEVLGRVSSIDWAVSTALLPLSYAITAPMASYFGVRATLLAVGLTGAGVTLLFLGVPGVAATMWMEPASAT